MAFIMHRISINNLVDVGMSPGDAIQLREYTSKWWAKECQHVAKCPYIPEHHAMPIQAAAVDNSTPPNEYLHFEKCYNSGGCLTTYGRAIVDSKEGYDEATNYIWWMYSKDLKMYIQLPPDKLPILAEDLSYVDEEGNVF